jgi:hypothetical protein
MKYVRRKDFVTPVITDNNDTDINPKHFLFTEKACQQAIRPAQRKYISGCA